MRRIYTRTISVALMMAGATLASAQTLTLGSDKNEITASEAGTYDKVEYNREAKKGQTILASFPAKLDGYYFGPGAQRLIVRDICEDANGKTQITTTQMTAREDFVPGKQYLITPTQDILSITCLVSGRKISVPETTTPLVFRTVDLANAAEVKSVSNCQTLTLSFTESGMKDEWEGLSTKEVGKITHSYDDNGNGLVQVNMKDGAIHVYSTDSLENIVSTTGENLSAYENGDLLEITRDEDYDVDTTFLNIMCPGTGMYAYFKTIAKLNNTLLRRSESLLRPFTLHYHIYDFTYVSTDYDGQKIRLSGRMFYPYSTDFVNGKKLELSKVFLENHYTTLENAQSPTSSFENQQLAGMCTKGYLVIEPDYLGFGVTKNRSQLFVDQKLMSSHVVDCLKAAMQLKKKVNSDDSYVSIPIADDAPMLNEGVSQGASVAVGVQRYIENDLTDAERSALPQLEETRVCAGPYNPYLTVEAYAKWDSIYYCATLPMMVQGMEVAHPDILVDEEGKNIPIRDFFSDELNNTRYPEYRNYNVWEMLESKLYDSHEVMDALWQTFGNVEQKKASLFPMLNPALLNGKSLNTESPYIKALKNVLELSNNSHGWSPKAKLSMWHGPNDNIIPYDGSVQMYETIKSEYPDANINFTTIQDEGMGGHTPTCGIWMMGEILGVDVNLVVEIIKKLN